MYKLLLLLFFILILFKEQYSYEETSEDCESHFAQAYNPYFRNQQIDVLTDDCNFIHYNKMYNYTSKNDLCREPYHTLLMSQELLEKNKKIKLIHILYRNVSHKKFDFIKAYEEESNVYYVPEKPINETTNIVLIEKINCHIVDIITNYLSYYYYKMKRALFVRLTTDLYKEEIVLNLHIALLEKNNTIEIEKSTLVVNIKISHIKKMINTTKICTSDNANNFYKIKSISKNLKYFYTRNDISQVLLYNNFIITVEQLQDDNIFNYDKKVIQLRYIKDPMKPVAICLDKKFIDKPIYISFYNNYIKKREEIVENDMFYQIRNRIIYGVMTVIVILVVFLSCRNIQKEYNAILVMDKEIQEKIFGKKKGKKLTEILNEKLQQQHFDNDDGKGPIIPYAKFDKRFEEINKIPKKRVTGMDIKTLSKNIEYIST